MLNAGVIKGGDTVWFYLVEKHRFSTILDKSMMQFWPQSKNQIMSNFVKMLKKIKDVAQILF